MRISLYDLSRLCLFSFLTILEISLAIFLIFYGSELLKIFAILLLVVQVFSLHRIYLFITNIIVALGTKKHQSFSSYYSPYEIKRIKINQSLLSTPLRVS